MNKQEASSFESGSGNAEKVKTHRQECREDLHIKAPRRGAARRVAAQPKRRRQLHSLEHFFCADKIIPKTSTSFSRVNARAINHACDAAEMSDAGNNTNYVYTFPAASVNCLLLVFRLSCVCHVPKSDVIPRYECLHTTRARREQIPPSTCRGASALGRTWYIALRN